MQFLNLFYDDATLQSYLDNALAPLARGLSDHPALAAWEVLNEPEGLVQAGRADDDPCYDTVHLTYTSAGVGGVGRAPGWAGDVPFERVLRFVNLQAGAIRRADPKALVSTGSWSPYAQSEADFLAEDSAYKYGFNHYKDECLVGAGGDPDGTMDFWRVHCYCSGGEWYSGAPWTGRAAADYGMDAPLVVGEFYAETYGQEHDGVDVPEGNTTEWMVSYLYEGGFGGGWTWFYGGDATEAEDADVEDGLAAVAGRTDHGAVEVAIA